ncbi:MAG: right-handed parallel beta-helix repeat-containing protein [Halobacteriota archaeon]
MIGARASPGIVALVVLLSTALAGTGFAVGPAAAAGTDVTRCTTITTPGVYTLQTDLSNVTATQPTTAEEPSAACISIQSDDVVFDGGAHDVAAAASTATDSGVAVSNGSAARSNVTIRNVTVSGWGSGVRVDGGESVTVDAVEASDNFVGVLLKRATDATVTDSTVNRNERGIRAENVERVTLSGLLLESNALFGVDVLDGQNVTVTESRVSFSQFGGVVFINTTESDVRANDLGSNQRAVDLFGGDGTTVVGNNLSFSNSEGVRVFQSDGVTVRDNAANDSINTGVLVTDGSDDVVVVNNTADGNGFFGISVVASDNASLANNTARENGLAPGGAGIRVVDSENATSVNDTASHNEFDGFSLENATDAVVRNGTTRANAEADFQAVDASRATVEALALDPTTTISFEGETVALRAVPSDSRPPDPGELTNASAFVEVTNTSADESPSLSVRYTDEAVAGLDESTLRLWRYDRSWSAVSGENGVDTDRNVVVASVTDVGVFAPLGERLDSRSTNDDRNESPSLGDERLESASTNDQRTEATEPTGEQTDAGTTRVVDDETPTCGTDSMETPTRRGDG